MVQALVKVFKMIVVEVLDDFAENIEIISSRKEIFKDLRGLDLTVWNQVYFDSSKYEYRTHHFQL